MSHRFTRLLLFLGPCLALLFTVIVMHPRIPLLAASTNPSHSQNSHMTPASLASGCGVWNTIPNPTSPFVDVSGISMYDAWAVGSIALGSSTSHAFIQHWNGLKWKVVPSPHLGQSSTLEHVRVFTRDNVWVAGSFTDGNNISQKLFEHWNGLSWKITTTPMPEYPTPHPTAPPSFHYPQPPIAYWDGTNWSLIPSVNAQGEAVQKIIAFSTHDALALGSVSYNTNGTYMFSEHWNGRIWTLVPFPTLAFVNGYDEPFQVPQSRHVVVKGAYYNGATGFVAFLEYWNGREWSVISTPGLNSSLGQFQVLPLNDFWGVEDYIEYHHEAPQQFLVHIDQKGVTVFTDPFKELSLGSLVEVPLTHQIWVLAQTNPYFTAKPSYQVIEHYC